MAKQENMIINLILRGKDLVSDDVKNASKSVEELEKKLNDLEKQQQENNKRNKEYQESLKQLSEQEKQYNEVIKKLEKEKDDLSKANLERFKKQVEAVEKEKKVVEQNLAVLETSNQSNQNSLNFYKKQAELLEKQLNSVSKNYEELKKSTKGLSNAEGDLSSQIAKTKKDLEGQEKVIAKKTASVKKLREETDKLLKSQASQSTTKTSVSSAPKEQQEKELKVLAEKNKQLKEIRKETEKLAQAEEKTRAQGRTIGAVEGQPTVQGSRKEGYEKNTQLVSVSEMLEYMQHDRDIEKEEYKKLADDIKKHGIKEPLKLMYDPESGDLVLAEGNHRLKIAQKLGIENVPVVVVRGKDPEKPSRKGFVKPKAPRDYPLGSRVPTEILPSDVGVGASTAKEEIDDLSESESKLSEESKKATDKLDAQSRITKHKVKTVADLYEKIVTLAQAEKQLEKEIAKNNQTAEDGNNEKEKEERKEKQRLDAKLRLINLLKKEQELENKAADGRLESTYELQKQTLAINAAEKALKRLGVSEEEINQIVEETSASRMAEESFIKRQARAAKENETIDKKEVENKKKRSKAVLDFINLLEKQQEVVAKKDSGDEKAIAVFNDWVESIKKIKRTLLGYGVSRKEIEEIERKSAKSAEDRAKRLSKAELDYAKTLRSIEKLKGESIELDYIQELTLKNLKTKKEDLAKQITILGGNYEELEKKQNSSIRTNERNSNSLVKLRRLLSGSRDNDRFGNSFGAFALAFRNAAQESSVLSRRLGRLGLAIRGLVIVGVLAFMQGFVSVVGALGAQITALISSLLSAAAVLVVSFIPAIAQAIPIVGALGAAFSRLSAIQEAVQQADLAKKQAFGDTGPEKKATDAALKIADAQRRVKEAQQEVTKARKEAKKELEELILKEKEAELAFKSATLSQLESKRALRETIRSGDVESVARDQLGVEESGLGKIRARRDLREARQANRQGKRGGPKGTETYKNAVKSLTDAQRALADAQRSAADSAQKQVAAQRNLAFFLNELSAAEKRLYKQFMRLRERYEKVFRPITDIIINSFADGLAKAEKIIFDNKIVSGFRTLAKELSFSIDKIFGVLVSPEFKQFFVDTLSEAAKNTPIITDAFILLLNIFKEISTAAAPTLTRLLEFIVEKLGEFNDTVSNTESFSEFLTMGAEHFEAWIELIISILGLLGEIMQASSGSAIETISSLTDTINGAKESLKSDDSGARTFFDDAAESAKFIGGVIVDLGKAIVELTSSKQVKALADIFTEMLIPGLVMGVKIVGVFALGLDHLLEIPIVAKMLQLGVATFFVVSAFTAIQAIFRPATRLILDLSKAVRASNIAIGGWSGAFSTLGGKISKIFPGLGALLGNMKTMRAAFKEVAKSALRFVAIFGLFGRSVPQLKGVFTIVDKIGKVFSKLIPIFSKLRPLLAFLPKILTKAFVFLGPVGTIITIAIELIIGMINALRENFLGVGDAMSSALSELGEAFSELFGGGEGGNLLTFLMDIAKVIFDIIGFIGKLAGAILLFGVIEAVIKPLTVVIKIVANTINTVKEFISLIKKGQIGEAFKTLAGGVARGLAMALGLVIRMAVMLPRLIIKLSGKVISSIAKLVWSAIKGLGGLIFNLGKTLFNYIVESFTSPSAWSQRFNSVINALKDFASSIWEILKSAGSGLAKGLIEGLGVDTANWIINAFVDIINGLIEVYNKIPALPDIGKIEKADIKLKEEKSPKKTSSKDIDKETESEKKSTKAKKDSSKASLDSYKALNLSGGASRKNARLNNQLAGSLDKSSKAHRKAQRLQEGLNKAAERGREKQKSYAESIRKTAAAEERMARALSKSRGSRKEINEKERASEKIRTRLEEKTSKAVQTQTRFNEKVKNSSSQQNRYNSSLRAVYGSKIRYGAATKVIATAQSNLNSKVRTADNLQEKYSKSLRVSTRQTNKQEKEIRQLSKKFVMLNSVLKITGENSRALGLVFKNVTNKLLSEFNVEPIKVKLPSVDGMFKKAMGDSQGFQRGGYFGQKGQRGPDDRTIMVAGGEAILTGNHQAAVDTAFSIANQTSGFPYQNLDSMFNKDKRPHATAKKYNRGGRVGKKGSIIIPKSVPDAKGALPGLDLMGWLLGKYFGLSVTDGIRAAGTKTTSGNISDHTWGGAIDVSNSGSPSPQMDAAWRWLTKTIGGGAPTGFVEDYRGGAIKQMLYRTMIGGNHFDHIHLALLENYARNVESLTKILTGEAIPVATGGGMFSSAPQLKKPTIKTNNEKSIKNLFGGQAAKLTKGANKYLKNKIVADASSGMSYAPVTAAIEPGSKIKTGYTVYNDPPPGSFGPLNNGYAELGTATTAGLTGGGYLAQALGLGGELPENFPFDVTINGKTKRLYKRDRGWGQGSNSHGIDIWQDSWGFFGLNANSSGQAVLETANKKKKKGKPGPQYQAGGLIPEFDNGGIVPGPIGAPRLVKAHGGETILPTHKYNTGGIVPRYQAGGLVAPTTTFKEVSNQSPARVKKQLDRLRKRLSRAETSERKSYIKLKIEEFKDRLLLSKEIKKINNDIKKINKEIKDTEKKLRTAEGDKKKELEKSLKELKTDLKEAKSDKKSVAAFEGQIYDLRNVNEFILLISDRIESSFRKIEQVVSKLALATAKWTFKVLKIDGKTVVSRVNSSLQEAQRGLSDLLKEGDAISKAIKETQKGEKKARTKLRKERAKSRRQIKKLQNELDKAGKIENAKERKQEEERIKKELNEARKERKASAQKLKTSINKSRDKRKELEQRQAENIASIYEQQQRIFEEELSRFDRRFSKIDTMIEIATLKNQTDSGQLSEQGRAEVIDLYTRRGNVFSEQRKFLESQLAEARKAKDIERQKDLEQALLENELAILQNTQSIKELDGSINGIFDFRSTNWEMFRKAVFTGNSAQVLPQFASSIPQLASGGYITKSGLAYLHAAEVVVPASPTGTRNSGPLVDTINFTQPMEVADPIAVSNQIGFKLSTLKSTQ